MERREEPIKRAMYYGSIDSTCSLLIALFVNASILMVSAATFHTNGYNDIATLQDASKLLEPLLKSKAAPILFAVALLASGQNSTLTGTLAGQIVMEGFMTMKITPALRRVLTRLLAIVPSIIAVAVGGNSSANYLLILSQVILSFALPFAVVPLVHISSCKRFMGEHCNSWPVMLFASAIAILIIVLNIILVAL